MFMALLFMVLGLGVGSFLNVVISRTYEPLDKKSRRSICRHCQQPIAWFDLIPVASWIILRAKCRKCRNKISLQYPAVELATAVLFVAVFAHYWYGWFLFSPVSPELILWLIIRDCIFVSFLILIFVYDLRYQIIPDRFSVSAMFVALLINLALGFPPSLLLYGAAVLGIFFLMQFMVSKGRWIGGGDIRLGVVIGLMLGLWNGLATLFFAYIAGAIFSIGLILAKKVNMQTKIAFGTFLSGAAIAMLFFGEHVIEYYLSAFHL